VSVMAWPDHLLSMADWDALPEDNTHRYEVAEGVLHVSPQPVSNHQWAVSELILQLQPQLPADFRALPDVEVALFETFPVTVRVPDLAVVPRKVARTNPSRYTADDVVLVIEVVSPGSVRIDNVMKLDEYAKAGIERYWIVDVDDPATITVYELADGCYKRSDETSGTLRVETPAPVIIDVTALTP
jgi:Uma2 family endonuclease